MTDPITDRQWGAYVAVCAERDRYREALRRIVHGGPHDPQYIALDSLDWITKEMMRENQSRHHDPQS